MTPHDLVLFLRWRYDPRYADASDGALLEQYFVARDELALRALVWRHAGPLFNLCRVELGDLDAADDVFQDTILALHRHGQSLRKKQAVLAWLLKTARRICVRKRKQRDRRLRVERRVARTESVGDPAEAIGRDEERRIVARAIGQLPDRYGVPLHLGLHGLSAEQIGEALQLPVATVKTRITRGRKLLLAKLQAKGMSATVVGAVLAERSDAAPKLALIAGAIKAALADLPPTVGVAASVWWLKPALGVLLVGGAAAGGIGWGMRPKPADEPPETVVVAETLEERDLRLLRTEVVPKLSEILRGFTLGGSPPRLIVSGGGGTQVYCDFELEHKPFGRPDAKPWFRSKAHFVFDPRCGGMRLEFDAQSTGQPQIVRRNTTVLLTHKTGNIPNLGFSLPGVDRLWDAFAAIPVRVPERIAPEAYSVGRWSKEDLEFLRPRMGRWFVDGDRYRPQVLFVDEVSKAWLVDDKAGVWPFDFESDSNGRSLALFGRPLVLNADGTMTHGSDGERWTREPAPPRP